MLNTNFHENDNILNSVDESEVQLKKNQQEKRVQLSPFTPHQYQVRRSGNFGFENYIWKQNALNILTLVLRFIKILTQTCFTQQFNLLNEKLFNIIGDVTSDFQYYSLKDYFKDQQPMKTERFYIEFCQNQYKKLVETYFVKQILQKLIQFKPESMFLFIWNIYILFILNLSLLYISAKFAFKLDERNSIYESYRYSFLYLLPIFSFVVEFILKLNTQFYEKGQLIDNRKEIIKHYLKTGFTLDLIVILSQILNFYAKINHLDLLVLLKIFQIPSLLEHLLDKLELTNYHFAIYDLSRLCYFILIETHFVCCGWYFVGSLNEEKNWLKQLDIEDTDWIIQYSHSFYWSIVTMTTIGYGDVIPQNIYEKYFVIIVALISCCTFGYSISNIGQIFAQLSKKQNQARIDLNNLKKYLKQKKYSSDIQIKVLRYFEYIWSDEHIDNVQNFQHFKSLLPCQLKNDMILDLNLKALNKVPFLQSKFSEQFLTQLSVLFQEEIYGPDQIIFQRNTQSNYFYILLEGAVELYIDLSCKDGKEKKTQLETINSEYSILGHKEFFSETVYNVNCKAINSARCIRVKREDFQSVAEKYGWQQYCQIRDLLQQTGKNDEVNLTCFGCKKKSHFITQCPLTTGFPNKTKIILNYRKKYLQDRHYYKRKNVERRMHSVKDENDISDSVLCYLLRDQTLRQKFQNHFQFETTDSQVSIKKYEKNISSKHKRKNLRFVFQQFARPSYMRELQNIAKQQNIYQYDTEIQQVIQDEISESERVKLDNDLCKSVNYKLKVDAGQTYPFLNKFEPKSIVKQSQQKYDESLDIQTKKEKSRMLAESIRIIGINASSLRNELFSDSNINYEQQSYYPKKNENSNQTSIGLKMGKYQEIFNDFDRAQNYENYLTHMNLNIILTEFEEMQNQKGLYNFLNQNIKQKNRKQTIFILKH